MNDARKPKTRSGEQQPRQPIGSVQYASAGRDLRHGGQLSRIGDNAGDL
jgi:hypothetical protein